MEEGFKPCPYCAEPIREAAVVCRYCNRSVTPAPGPRPPTDSAERRNPTIAPQSSTSSRLRTSVLVLVFVGLVIVLILGLRQQSHFGSNPLLPAALLQPVPVSHKLLDGNLEVEANQMRWVTFTVPPNCANTKVGGAFHASGGAGNDIQVLVTDTFNFENWKNNHETRLLYDSGKVTNGDIAVEPLPPGQYVLAFDNRFSAFSRKQVTGQITLSYLQP